MASSLRMLSIFALLMPATIAVAQTNLGTLLDTGGTKLSAEEFRRELVGRPIVGLTAGGISVEVVYLDSGDIRGAGASTLLGGAVGGGATFDVYGSWTIGDGDRICTSMVIGRSMLPPRCQYWYRLGQQYFFCDSDYDRSARVFVRNIKQ